MNASAPMMMLSRALEPRSTICLLTDKAWSSRSSMELVRGYTDGLSREGILGSKELRDEMGKIRGLVWIGPQRMVEVQLGEFTAAPGAFPQLSARANCCALPAPFPCLKRTSWVALTAFGTAAIGGRWMR